MSHPNGTKAVKCPYCGSTYHLNNFNRRWPGKRATDGKLLDDTHLIEFAAQTPSFREGSSRAFR
jgi:hypothetical protein